MSNILFSLEYQCFVEDIIEKDEKTTKMMGSMAFINNDNFTTIQEYFN